MTVTALIIMAFGLVIAYKFSNIVLKPIRSLLSAMQRNGEGQYTPIAQTNTKDELGKLTTVYNLMVDDINQYTEDLRTTNLHLEEKVRIRTLELEQLSNNDGLTGIANRRKLDEHLATTLALWQKENLPISIMMIDIDFFKAYNDTYGHPQGDNV